MTAFLNLNLHTSSSVPQHVQTESRGGAYQEGGGKGQEGVHQAGVPEEEAVEADGGHGHHHQAPTCQAEAGSTKVHPPGQHGLPKDSCESSHRYPEGLGSETAVLSFNSLSRT